MEESFCHNNKWNILLNKLLKMSLWESSYYKIFIMYFLFIINTRKMQTKSLDKGLCLPTPLRESPYPWGFGVWGWGVKISLKICFTSFSKHSVHRLFRKWTGLSKTQRLFVTAGYNMNKIIALILFVFRSYVPNCKYN